MEGQHKSWKQYTTNDGLPGNKVFDIIQAHDNHLWIVTDHGICRFNGYDFDPPVDTSIYAGGEAFNPMEDPDGRIWFVRLDWSLWFIEDDTVRAWKYNYILDLFKHKFGSISNYSIDEDGTFSIALTHFGCLVVHSDGSHQIVRGSPNRNIVISTSTSSFVFADQLRSHEGSNDVLDVIFWENNELQKASEIKKRWTDEEFYASAWPLTNGDVLMATNGQISQYRGKQLFSNFKTDIINPNISETQNGNLLVASFQGEKTGLFYYASLDEFKEDKGSHMLTNNKVCDILCDHEGGWWAATLGDGIFYCSNPNVDIYDITDGLSTSNVLRLATDGKENLYAAMWPFGQSCINSSDKTAKSITGNLDVGLETWALYYDTLDQKLWRSAPLEYFQAGSWFSADKELKDKGRAKKLIAKEIFRDPNENSLWMSLPYGFLKLNLSTFTSTHLREVNESLVPKRTFSVISDYEKNIWVATIDGLRLWKDGDYIMPPFDHPALRFQAGDIKLSPDSSIIIGFHGGGILIWDQDHKLTHLNTENGLSTDYITKIYVAPGGDLYACSKKGLHHIQKKPNDAWKINVLGTKSGLPSNHINDACIVGGQLWVATEKGLATVSHRRPSPPILAPKLESFHINQQEHNYIQDIELHYSQNNIKLEFYSLYYYGKGEILYRYRLPFQDTAFIYSTSRDINLLNLASGKYVFEVEAANEDGKFSPSTQLTFEILPPWWRSWWFLLLMTISIAGTCGWIIHKRFRAIKTRATTSNKIRDLEMAALRGQMNPHFIFNCLGSIQQFITENDSRSATRYLARFAKLIRLSLHSSVDGKHTLREEVEMLDNYLALELMRFKGKFTYRIEVYGDLDQDDIYLPPMLIQPFVENALKHGMKNKSEEGLIDVTFTKEKNVILVCVSDNGPGFSQSQQSEIKSHKSFGMSLTKKRLDILSNSAAEINFIAENIIGPNHEINGSMVLIRIPVE